MNNQTRIKSWDPNHKDLKLEKRGSYEVNFQDFELNSFTERGFRGKFDETFYLADPNRNTFSPERSNLTVSQQAIVGLSYREAPYKYSQKYINRFDKLQDSYYNGEQLANNKLAGEQLRFSQHDNNPLNNSVSNLDKDIFRKSLSDKDSMVEGPLDFKKQQRHNNGDEGKSCDSRMLLNQSLSEFGQIKPPNFYRELNSINYSNINDDMSICDDSAINKLNLNTMNRGIVDDSQICMNSHNINSKRIFDIKSKGNVTSSLRNLNKPYNKIKSKINIANNLTMSFTSKQIPISEKMMNRTRHVNKNRNYMIQNTNNNISILSPSKFNKKHTKDPNIALNILYCSEKLISINHENVKKRCNPQLNLKKLNSANPEPVLNKWNKTFISYEKPLAAKETTSSVEDKEVKELNHMVSQNNKIEINMKDAIALMQHGPYKKYKDLLYFLISLFVKGEVQIEKFQLNEEELQILKIIIFRKFKKHVDINLEKKSLVLKLCSIANKSCLKKNEERWKFIYKKSIKALKMDYFLKHTNDDEKAAKPTENDFLKYYFQECAKKEKVPLDFYKDPLIQKYRKRNDKSKKKDDKCPKSINTRYLGLIFQSDHFVTDFFNYIDFKFKIDYLNEIPEKFLLIFKNYINCDSTIDFSKEYFQNNKRCKLPWTFHDVDLAIQAMKEINREIQTAKNKSSDFSNVSLK